MPPVNTVGVAPVVSSVLCVDGQSREKSAGTRDGDGSDGNRPHLVPPSHSHPGNVPPVHRRPVQVGLRGVQVGLRGEQVELRGVQVGLKRVQVGLKGIHV